MSSAAPADAIPPSSIASGVSLWVDSNPVHPLLNARVDVGTIRALGDELAAEVRFTVTPGERIDARLRGEPIPPEGGTWTYAERVVCTPGGIVWYSVEEKLFDPAGQELRHTLKDAGVERAKAEATRLGTYGSSAHDLICWAVARKCDGASFTWPPPPNLTPLEHSERASRMRAAYNARFVPSCRI